MSPRTAHPQPGEESGRRAGPPRRSARGCGRGHPRREAPPTAQPAPGAASSLTNQALNHLNAPVEAAWRELDTAEDAAAVPARIRLGDITPDMARLDTEIKQITHAIRMAAYNAETAMARARGMQLVVRGGDQAGVVGFGHRAALALAPAVDAGPVEQAGPRTGPVAGQSRHRDPA